MKIAKYVLPVVVAAVGFVANPASAAVTAWFTNIAVPNGVNIVDGFTLPFGPPGAVLGNLDGFVANDLTVTSTTDWTAAAIVIDLSSGSIWNEPDDAGAVVYNGTTLGPNNPAFYPALPSSEFDSYLDSNGDGSSIAIAGAGGDAGGILQQFDTARIDISWNSLGGDTNDIGANALGRFTLSGDANGTLTLAVTEAGSPEAFLFTISIVSGIIFPEPASLALMGLGGLAALRRRR